MEPFDERAVKGVFLRTHQADGVAILAFWDIRHANIAREVLSSTSNTALSICVGDEKPWIKCRFIAVDELVRVTHMHLIIGQSNTF
jgi:hypothetical protein